MLPSLKKCVSFLLLSCLVLLSAFLSFADGFYGLENARASAVYDCLKEEFIYENNSCTPLPVASTTKIMTCLLTLEQQKLSEEFLVPPEALKTEGSSMGLSEGDRVNLKTLALGMMLPSGNDAANAAAIRIAGSKEKFVSMMNERAKALGMENTRFSTPSGLDEGGNFSSARDMALLASAALKNEEFRRTASLKTFRADVGERYLYLKNHNRLLFRNESVTGIKTGFTKKAGRCLVSSACLKGREFIIVTLNMGDDFNVHENVYRRLDSSLLQISPQKLFKGGFAAVAGTGERVSLMIGENSKIAVFENELSRIKTYNKIPPFLYAPVNVGDEVGSFAVSIDEKEILSLAVYASNRVQAEEQLSLFEGAWLSLKNFFGFE